jgi:hypothetical protein
MPLKSLTNQTDKDEVLRRLANISSPSPRRWGKMTAHQMVCHLADSFRGVMGEKPLSRAPGPLPRTLMKWIGLYVPLPWPHGIKTRPEMDAQLQGTPPGEFGADLEELRRLLERFTRRPREFTWHPHPIFDHMSDWEWARWGYLHMDHHLRQFGA